MHDAPGVGGDEDVEELIGDPEHVAQRESLPPALPALLDRLAFEHLHDDERRAVRSEVVVEDAHRPLVLDRVGGVALL